jgi:Na+/melibiose symporter-like transporter
MPFILEATHFVTREQNMGQAFLDQPASAVLGIKIMIGFIPGLAMFLGAIILAWFPLRGAYLERVKHEVLELHALKHEKLEKLEAE